MSDQQLHQVFNFLENSPDGSTIYERWIRKIHDNNSTFPNYGGLNLDDPKQRVEVFNSFRFNMDVIDFWLSTLIYPHELKMFERKLKCTAWDLCSEQLKYSVTGFSGTNDTKELLPLTIFQNDLQKLENTNTKMRQTLLNRSRVQKNTSNMNGMQILEELVKQKIPVLLDSGALMLEMNNREVASKWLNLTPDCRAAIYFDENDILQAIDRNGIVIEFDYSAYRENLKNCVIYLDDVHTRGTDLKFEAGWTACVTLSGKY